MRHPKWNVGWRGRKALRSARMLDDVVDAQVALLPQLSDETRRQSAEYLAELVMLAQAYRHFAVGWISRRELERRGRQVVERLEAIRPLTFEQLTERE